MLDKFFSYTVLEFLLYVSRIVIFSNFPLGLPRMTLGRTLMPEQVVNSMHISHDSGWVEQ